MDERQRNEFAFTYERFRMVGQNRGLSDPLLTAREEWAAAEEAEENVIQVERLASIAGAVRAQLLRQVEEADLQRNVVLRAHMETVPISQDERQRDLLLIQSQAHVNVELAAISYLEHEGEVVNAIMALNEGTAQSAHLVEGLPWDTRRPHRGLVASQTQRVGVSRANARKTGA